jgi:putative oxidoreductase
MKWLEKYEDYAYALLRMATGFLFAFHGVQLIFGVFSEFQPPAWSQLWFGGIIELVGGILVMLGYQTRAAAFLCSGTMAVAYLQYHWKFQLGSQLLPALNKGELSVLYSFIFFLIACRGGIKWSLDKTK